MDDATAAPHLAVIVRAISMLLVIRRLTIQVIKFPPNGVVFRGGGLPEEHRGFYESGREFRVPGFLASSFAKETAEHFMCSARARGEPCVMWEIHVDPAGERSPAKRCMHVNYVERSNLPGEMEYLFAPYSPFTVKQVRQHREEPWTRRSCTCACTHLHKTVHARITTQTCAFAHT
jgi:hypothetical protein